MTEDKKVQVAIGDSIYTEIDGITPCDPPDTEIIIPSNEWKMQDSPLDKGTASILRAIVRGNSTGKMLFDPDDVDFDLPGISANLDRAISAGFVSRDETGSPRLTEAGSAILLQLSQEERVSVADWIEHRLNKL